MKLNITRGDFETSKMTIVPFKLEAVNVGQITQTLAESLYKNVFSFVRESVSNAKDAVTRKGSGKVIVSLEEHAGTYMFSVRDTGTGMTPEQFERFISFGASDKRDSSNELGYWGLGSKSPFAYTDAFYLITIAEGQKYTYTLSKVEQGYGYVLNNVEPTSEESGTTIFISIPTYRDVQLIANAIKEDLQYFENIVFHTNIERFQADFEQLNNNVVYKFKNFVWSPMENEPCLILNGVRYNIDRNAMSKNGTASGLNDMPYIGILLPTDGSVAPIPSREDLQYTDKAIEIIRDLIKKVKEELVQLAQVQVNSKFSNLEEYIKFLINWKTKQFTLQFDGKEMLVSKNFLTNNGFKLDAAKIGYNFDLNSVLEKVVRQYEITGIVDSSSFKNKNNALGKHKPTNVFTLIFLNDWRHNVTLSNMFYMDKDKDRKTSAYFLQNIKQTYYLVSKNQNNRQWIVDSLKQDHNIDLTIQQIENLEKVVEEIIFPNAYSKIQVPADWKPYRASYKKGDKVAGTKEITFYVDGGSRRTQQLSTLVEYLSNKTLVYCSKDEEIYGFSYLSSLSSNYFFATFSNAGLKLIEKCDIKKITPQQFFETDDFKSELFQYLVRKKYKETYEFLTEWRYNSELVAFKMAGIKDNVKKTLSLEFSKMWASSIIYYFDKYAPIYEHEFDFSKYEQMFAQYDEKVELAKEIIEATQAFAKSALGIKLLNKYITETYSADNRVDMEVFYDYIETLVKDYL